MSIIIIISSYKNLIRKCSEKNFDSDVFGNEAVYLSNKYISNKSFVWVANIEGH